MSNSLNNLYDMFIVIGSIVTGTVIATIITAYIIYEPEPDNNDKNTKKTTIISKQNITKFESELDTYLKNINTNFDTLEITQNNNTFKYVYTTVDKLPVGIIHIIYENNVFYYFANNNSIPFKWLEVAAKVYCLKNNCKHIFKTYQLLNSKDIQPDDDIEMHQIIINEDNAALSDNSSPSPNPNTDSNLSNINNTVSDNNSDTDDKKNKDDNVSDDNVSEDNTSDDNNNIFIKRKKYKLLSKPVNKEINKYKYKGNLTDYDNFIKTTTNAPKSLKLTFNDYKNMIKKNNTLL